MKGDSSDGTLFPISRSLAFPFSRSENRNEQAAGARFVNTFRNVTSFLVFIGEAFTCTDCRRADKDSARGSMARIRRRMGCERERIVRAPACRARGNRHGHSSARIDLEMKRVKTETITNRCAEVRAEVNKQRMESLNPNKVNSQLSISMKRFRLASS